MVMEDRLHRRNDQIINYIKENVSQIPVREGSSKREKTRMNLVVLY